MYDCTINTPHHITGCHCEAILNEIPAMATQCPSRQKLQIVVTFLEGYLLSAPWSLPLDVAASTKLLPLFGHMTLS